MTTPNPVTMTSLDILACKRPEDLFPVGDLAHVRKVYRTLALQWHPDLNHGQGDVFAHVTKLHGEALTKLAAGNWEGAGVVFLTMVGGKEIALQTRTSVPFALGQTLVTDNAVMFLVEPAYGLLFLGGRQASGKGFFKFSSGRMEKETDRYLPHRAALGQLRDGRHFLQVAKTPDLLRLADVVKHSNGLDPKHVAWVVSSLLNLCCYLSYAGIVHQDISPDTYYISPRFHSGALLGGWWYWARRGEPISAVPKRTYDLMPFKARNEKTASALTDLELVRATGRECLGGKKAPAPMKHWLEQVGTGSAVEQYQQWLAVLNEAFGERRFVELKLDADAVYGRQEATHG